jgi:poly-gamma-glutamate synthesis protein (capsule biosynthesis protein)
LPILLILILLLGATAAVFAGLSSRQPSPPIGGDTTGPESQPVIGPVDSSSGESSPESGSSPLDSESDPSSVETDPPEPSVTYTDVTLLSTGDIMFHRHNVLTGYDPATGTYSYLDVFQYLGAIVNRYDYAVANLETTISGPKYEYTQSNSWIFNAPDSAIDAFKSAGFNMMLFANNHTNDCDLYGIRQTITKLNQNGIDTIGAVDDLQKDAWKILDLKGTKIGMLNYTNDGSWGTIETSTLNGRPLGESADYVNVFYLSKMDEFYERVEQDIADIRAAGADLVVFYIHWGPEYYIEPQDITKQIAQTLCNMGVDAIIGSHPHVIQPMDTLVSTTDPNHSTLCFYSLGNYLSNQNRAADTWSKPAPAQGYSENGLTVKLTIRRYNNGETVVSKLDYTPTWVHRYYENGQLQYNILPLPIAENEYASYGLTKSSHGIPHAIESFQRTNDAMKEDVAAFNQNAQEVMARLEGKA